MCRFCPLCALARRIRRWARRRRPLSVSEQVERDLARLHRHEQAAREAGWWR